MEVRSGYKQTEVGLIPEKWAVKRLGDLGKVVRGGSPRPAGDPRYFDGNFIPWLTVAALTNIPDHKLGVTDTETCLTEEGSKHSRTLPAETLIIANSGATLGVAKLLKVTCCANDGIAAIINQRFGEKRFISYYINTLTKKLREVVATGNGQPNLNTGLIRDIHIPYPEPSEQRAIAEALSDVDGLLGELDRLIAKKRDLKQAAMQQLLTGHTRLPGFHGEWQKKKFAEVLKYERPDKYLVRSSNYEDKGDTPVLTANKSFVLGYTNEGFGIYESLPAIIFDDFTTDSKYVDFPFKVKSSAIKILKPRSDEVHLKFVFERMRLLQFPLGEHKRYYISEYQYIALPTPGRAEQAAIAEVLTDMDRDLGMLEAQREKTRNLKQAMMQELLTGNTRLI